MKLETLPQPLIDYSRQLFSPERAEIADLTQRYLAAGMPQDWEVSPEVGKLFQLLCRANKARRILEFGCFAGHSAYYFATSLPEDGVVVSLEVNPTYAEFASKELERLGVGKKVQIRVTDCLSALAPLQQECETAGKFDIIFLDADKSHYPEFLEWVPTALQPGGLLLADNVLHSESWGGQTLLQTDADDPRILAIRRFNQNLAENPRFTAMILPIRAGIAAAYFHG